MSETFRSLIEESSSSTESLKRKDQRLIQLHSRQIPILRLGGLLLLVVGLVLHNGLIPGSVSATATLVFLGMTLVYCGTSWALLARCYRPRSRFDLGLLFLTLDVFHFTIAVYLSGGEKSLLFFILLSRVADQTTAGFRRALFFAHLIPVVYGAMLLYIAFVDGRSIPLEFAAAMLIFLYGAGIYLAQTAKPNDRRRRRAAEAVRVGRELIRRLKGQSEELTEAKARAEAANEAKSRFLNNSSHELRTPLNATLGLLQMLLGTKLDREQEEIVTAAQEGAEKLLGTVDDIIDYSALEYSGPSSEALPLMADRVDLRLLVRSTLRLAREAAEAKGIELAEAIDSGTPQTFISDSRKLRRVLVHLVTNAVKFSESGTVVVAARREGDTALRFEVRDSGGGIPPEVRSWIFEPFTQVDASAGRKQSGAGLGLALSRLLVEALGGEIGLEDDPDGGSLFWFTVEDHKIGSPLDSEESHLSEGTKVLVVEDDPINQKITYHQLRSLGVAVDLADDGVEALERLEGAPYDLVLMDIQMPELDGYETTRAFRKKEQPGHRTPIIALTAHALPSDRQRCLKAGMDEHLSKPVSAESLRAVLLRWIPGSESALTDSEPEGEPESGPSSEALHEATLERLRDLGARHGRNLLGEMAAIFLREVPGRVEQLGVAFSEGNDDQARFLAHSIKGSCNSLGVRILATFCREMEEALESDDLEAAASLYPEARQALEEAREALEKVTV